MLINGFPIAGGGDIEMKYATGSGSGTINVTGLDFKPQAIYLTGGWYNMQQYYCWGCLMFNGDELLLNNSAMSAGGLSLNDVSLFNDGFTLTVSNSSFGCSWHALGY